MARGADCEIQKVSLPPFSPGCEQGTSGPRGEWQPVLSGPALWQWQSGDKEKGWEEGLENWSHVSIWEQHEVGAYLWCGWSGERGNGEPDYVGH